MLYANPRIMAISSVVVGLLALAVLAVVHGFSPETVELAAFAGILMFLSLTDIDERRIPNACIIAAIVVRVVYMALALAMGWMDIGEAAYFVLSACAIGAALLVIALIADRVFGGETMGGGDLKLYVVAALFFGWKLGLFVIALSCILGIVAAVLLTRGNHGASGMEKGFFKRALPFGPFISFACVVVMLFGNIIPV